MARGKVHILCDQKTGEHDGDHYCGTEIYRIPKEHLPFWN